MHNAPPAFAQAIAQREPLFRPLPLSALARVIATKQIVHISDYSKDPAYKAGEPGVVRIVELAGARTLLNAPMLKEDEVVGVIGIPSRISGTPSIVWNPRAFGFAMVASSQK